MTNTYVQDQIAKVDVSEVLKKYDSIDELNKWGSFAAQAGIIPSGTTIPQAMAIIQTGKEIGLRPMQSFRSMNFIKGRLTMSVQLQLALAKQRGVRIENMKEEENFCEISLSRNGEMITCSYSLEDARKAGLIKQDGNYEKYLKQMLRWRATGDCLRMIAPDLVMGLLSPEEAESIEPFTPAPIIKEEKGKPNKQTFGPEPQPETVKPTEITGFVTGIRKETKTNRTTKKEFIVYHIKLDNNIEYSASGKDADSFMTLAKTSASNGLKVKINTKGDQYNTIIKLDTVEPDFNEPELTAVDDINSEPLPWESEKT